MENLIILLFDIGLVTIYSIVGIIGVFLIQLISYRVFNFNIYKFLKYNLVEKEMVKWNKN